jgi:hypothetical protein
MFVTLYLQTLFVTQYYIYIFLFFCGAATQRGSWLPHSWGFLDHTKRCTTVGRTPLDEWSDRRRDLYLTTHNTHNRQISMLLVVFEPTISAGERPQTYALDRAATGTGTILHLVMFIIHFSILWAQIKLTFFRRMHCCLNKTYIFVQNLRYMFLFCPKLRVTSVDPISQAWVRFDFN